MILKIYRIIANLIKPLLKMLLLRRVAKGREDSYRYIEKMGIPTAHRPKTNLVWVHAVSVGESLSSLSIIQKLVDNGYTVLITTSTLSSAQILKTRLPKNTIHQYAPLDCPDWVERFVKYWKPNLVLWFESELWPNTLYTLNKYRIDVILLNLRISEKTMRIWQHLSFILTNILKKFTRIYTQTPEYGAFIKRTTTLHTYYKGNLKYTIPAPKINANEVKTIKEYINNRPVWIAISTHEEDEDFIHSTIKKASKKFPRLLTIVIPRHPERLNSLLSRYTEFTCATRSNRDMISDNTQIYIADTLGEINMFLKLVPICFVGGSTQAKYGGHNPLEAITMKSAIIQGMETQHFASVTADLTACNGHIQVANPQQLEKAVIDLLTNPEKIKTLTRNAQKIKKQHDKIADDIYQDITEILEK